MNITTDGDSHDRYSISPDSTEPGSMELVAHRGNARDFPENTLPALQSAVDIGLRFVEFDVQMAADGEPVVIHDHALLRTTGLPGTVFEHGSEYLSSLRVLPVPDTAIAGPRNGIRIPLLSETVEWLDKQSSVTAFVEIKRASLRQYGHEHVLAKIMRVLEPLRGRCVIISFDYTAIHMARENYGHRIGWVLTDYDEHAKLKFEALKPEFLFCNHEKLPPGETRLWRGPWHWAIYEVTAPELAASLARRGVSFVETMAVAPMAQALRRSPAPA